MNCPQCGAPVEAGAKNCKYCGESIAQPQNNMPPQMNQMPMNPMQMQGQMMFCPKCGKEMKAEDKFCVSCGYFLQNTVAKANVEQKEIILAITAHLALILGVVLFFSMKGKEESLLFLVLPFVIAPIIYYYAGKNMTFASKHALQAFLWQTAVCTILISAYCYIEYNSPKNIIDKIFNLFSSDKFKPIRAFCKYTMYVGAIFMIYAAFKSFMGQEYKYPLMPRVMTGEKWIAVALCLCVCVGGVIYLTSSK